MPPSGSTGDSSPPAATIAPTGVGVSSDCSEGSSSGEPQLGSDQRRLVRVVLAFAAVYIIWGSTYLAIRFAIETLPPLMMASVRYLTAGAILFPILRRRVSSPITGRHWFNAAVVGTAMLLGGNGLVCWAEQSVPSGIAALLIATVPLWLIGLDWLIYRGPRPTPLMLVSIGVGLAGVYFLVSAEGESGERLHMPSVLALLAACVFWAIGSLYSRRHALPSNAFLATAMQMLMGGAALLAAGLVRGEWREFDPAAMSLESLLALAYLITFGAIVGLTAYVWLLKNCAPAHVSTYAFVNPVVAVILGAIFAGELFTRSHALASAAIVGSVVLITLTSRRKAAPASDDG